MKNSFSESVELWLKEQPFLNSIQNQFQNEWSNILNGLQEHLNSRGWIVKKYGNPTDMIQIFRSHWPNPEGLGIHFEVSASDSFRKKGKVALDLHAEQGLPKDSVFRKKIVDLLKTYEEDLVKFCAILSPSLATSQTDVVLCGSADLIGLNREVLIQATEKVIEANMLVEESIYLEKKTKLWRTDYWQEPTINLSFKGSVGGQKIFQNGGIFDSPVVCIDGTKAGNHHQVLNKPTHIMKLVLTKKIKRDEQIYLSCGVKSKYGGRIWFFGEGITKDSGDKHKYPALFEEPHYRFIDIKGQESWQHVSIEAKTRNIDEYNFAEAGVMMYFRVQTNDKEFLVNHIEFGRIER